MIYESRQVLKNSIQHFFFPGWGRGGWLEDYEKPTLKERERRTQLRVEFVIRRYWCSLLPLMFPAERELRHTKKKEGKGAFLLLSLAVGARCVALTRALLFGHRLIVSPGGFISSVWLKQRPGEGDWVFKKMEKTFCVCVWFIIPPPLFGFYYLSSATVYKFLGNRHQQLLENVGGKGIIWHTACGWIAQITGITVVHTLRQSVQLTSDFYFARNFGCNIIMINYWVGSLFHFYYNLKSVYWIWTGHLSNIVAFLI